MRTPAADDDEVAVQDMTPMIDVVFQLLIFFMLTMQFKEVEGQLLSQLPRVGTAAPAVPAPDLLELRVVLRAGDDPRARANHGGPPRDAAVCSVAVEGHDLGRLLSTEAAPAAADANKALYRAVGRKARELRDASAVRRVILDADPEVPYEHVLGAVDGLKQAGVDEVEFAANPRFQK